MEETLFFRVEDAKGIGPYCRDGVLRPSIQSVCCGHTDYMDTHPGPFSDSILRAWLDQPGYTAYVFGFDSLEALFMWFYLPEEQAYLVEHKMRISCYRTKDYIKGEKQMVAEKHTLKHIDYVEF